YIERLMKDWNSPVYAFFSRPAIEYVDSRRSHVFKCLARGCNKTIRRYLDKGDAKSTSNMWKHARTCYGEDVVNEITNAKDMKTARKAVKNYVANGTITAAFERKGKGKVTYSHRQHTKSETNLRPFEIVADRGFQCLMKTGRPHYYLPHPTTVSWDVKLVFARTRERIAKMLQEYDGELSFSTDAWTSESSHRAFVAVTVHLVHQGAPLSMVLDMVEVAEA
ncbi:hypothetical protein M378DRAFT_48599, partial [Amanita muscaria Koide BX008]